MEKESLIQFLLSRRSIRKFESTPVKKEDLETMLKVAMYAPSARNLQPWHFIVIDNRIFLNEITRIHPYSTMLAQAPLAVLICADDSVQEAEGYWTQDSANATMNLLYSAHALGYGACWMGIHPRIERIVGIRKLLHLPENIHPVSLVAIGKTMENREMPERFHADKIHTNCW